MRIREGDGWRIFTNNDGEVHFKKYSPLGGAGGILPGVYAEVLGKVLTTPVLICDRDHVIAAAGLPKKEVLERRAAPALEEIMESRQSYILENPQSSPVYAVEGYDRPAAAVYPILAAGDVCGAVILSAGEDRRQPSEADGNSSLPQPCSWGVRWRNKKGQAILPAFFIF